MCSFLCFIGEQAEARAGSWWSRAARLGRDQLGGLYHAVLLKATALPSVSQSSHPACSQMIEWGNTSIVQRFKHTMDSLTAQIFLEHLLCARHGCGAGS